MYSINRLFFFSLGSVCFLLVPFFWLALAFDFSALENFVVKLSTAEFVGYPIPELLGAAKGETVVDQVLRIKIFFTVLVVVYSLLCVGLSYLEGARRRIRFCARGISIPMFLLILGFWLKFINDDHIISKAEKGELFKYTIVCLVVSVLFFAYSFHSKKKVKPVRLPKSKENGDAKSSATQKTSSSALPQGKDGVSADDGVAKTNPAAEVPSLEPSAVESSSAEGDDVISSAVAEEQPEELSDPVDSEASPPDAMETVSEPDAIIPAEEPPDPVPDFSPPVPEELSDLVDSEASPPDAMGTVSEPDAIIPAEEPPDPVPDLPPPLPAEEPPDPVPDLPPPLPAEEPPDPIPDLPPPLPAELSSPEVANDLSIENLETEASEQEVPETKSVLPPPTSSPPPPEKAPPVPATESIAESYAFPSKKEESPDDQTGDSSFETDDKNPEELKPPSY